MVYQQSALNTADYIGGGESVAFDRGLSSIMQGLKRVSSTAARLKTMNLVTAQAAHQASGKQQQEGHSLSTTAPLLAWSSSKHLVRAGGSPFPGVPVLASLECTRCRADSASPGMCSTNCLQLAVAAADRPSPRSATLEQQGHSQ